jgi:hypothetical protein
LHKKVQELKEKSKDNELIIKTKLQEKDEAIQSMKEKYDTDIALLKDAISDMQQLLKNPQKLIEISKAAAFVIEYVGSSVVITIDPHIVKKIGIDDTTFFSQEVIDASPDI